MNNVFKFESLDGVPYIFDNNNGIIYEDLTSSNSDNTRIKEYNEMYLQNLRKSLAVFENLNLHDITVDEIANYYEESGFTELIFKMTDACNMRCKYCIYSEHYPDTLTYGNDYISTEIVMKAIDEYMGYIIKLKKNIPDKVPFIAFYGGEPLMAFEVIKEAINYVEEKYSDLNTQYTITTNGILLKNKEICNYLKSKNVIICLSFDGYKENHDRNRILSSNQPSYDQLISIITDNFQEYENIYSLCCIDTRTDLVKLYDFYKQNDRMSSGIIPHVLRFSFIFNQGSDYYNQFTKEEKEKFNYQLNLLREKYVSMAVKEERDWILDLLIGQEFIRLIDRVKFSSGIQFYRKGGCCVPGEKIYVYQDGRYGICEKVCCENIDLGNVYTGLDLNKIVKQMKNYDETVYKKCKDCPVSNICDLCFVNLNSSGELNLEENFCEKRKKYFESMFRLIIYIEKENPGYWERMINKQSKNNLSYIVKLQNLLRR